MLRLLSDENFHGDIVLLEWAAQNDRILLTHDRTTIPDFAYDRVLKEPPMPGAFIVNNQMAIRQAIDEILLLVDCTQQSEWSNIILYLPM